MQTLQCSDRASVPTGPLRVPSLAQGKQKVQLSIVVPTYNERHNVPELLHRMHAALADKLATYEIIIVDDDSPDGTWELAEQIARWDQRLVVLRRREERGLATAVVRGWQIARGDVLGVIDADLQHPPEIAAELWSEIERGADLAVASRHVQGGGVGNWNLFRRMVSRGAQLIALALLPEVVRRVADPMSGYFLVRRSQLAGAKLSPRGYKILIEVLARCRTKVIREVGYVFALRNHGESKATLKVYWDYLVQLVRLRFDLIWDSPFPKFAVVGLIGTLIDMGILYALSDPTTLAWGLTRSKLIAAESAMGSNFLLNDGWTFASVIHPVIARRFVRFLRFNAVCALGLLLGVALLNLQFNWLGINRYVANAFSIAAVTAWNYSVNRSRTWAPSGRTVDNAQPMCPPSRVAGERATSRAAGPN